MTSNFVIEMGRKAGEIFDANTEKGFHEVPRSAGDLVALATSELSEAYEEVRNGRRFDEVYFTVVKVADTDDFCLEVGAQITHSDFRDIIADYPDLAGHFKPEGWGTELADCVIRLMDTALETGVDLPALIELKLAYNETRSYRHGGKTI